MVVDAETERGRRYRATALGDVLVRRLRAAGHTYEVAPA